MYEYLLSIGAQADIFNAQVKIPSVSAIVALWRHLRHIRPDVLHLRGAEANFHGVIAGRLAGVPVIIAEEIGVPNHSPSARRIFARVYRHCTRLIAISQSVKHQIVSLAEATPEMIDVIYNPFEPQIFRPLPKRDGPLRLGFVGRLEAVKNPLAIIEAVSILRRKGANVFLRLVGDGTQRSAIEKRIIALDLSDHVELSGFHPRPFELLEDCHFYLQPSLTEGFGLAVCEAMSAGIPVIGSAVGGLPEIIDHGFTGWLLPNTDAQSLADAVEVAAALDECSLKEMVAAARASVIERFGVATYLSRLDDLYQTLSRQ